MDGAERTVTLQEAANEFGLTYNMVRRYVHTLDRLAGEEPLKDPRSRARLLTEAQLRTIEHAREMVRENSALSVEDALKLTLGMVSSPTLPASSRSETLEAILRELQHLRVSTESMLERLAALESENKALRDQLKVLPVSSSSDADETESLRRRIKYLHGELERRDRAVEEHHRQWWQFWRG